MAVFESGDKMRAPMKIYRGTIINPLNSKKCEFFVDGGLVVDSGSDLGMSGVGWSGGASGSGSSGAGRGTNSSGASADSCGKIVEIGDFKKIFKKYARRSELSAKKPEKKLGKNHIVGDVVVDTGGVILPAFTDVHLHWVQNRVKGSFHEVILHWLRDHIWPEEAKFKNTKYAEKMVDGFYKELLKNGTKNAMIYSSVHKEATEIAIKKGLKFGNFIIGNVLMDQHSPANLQMTTKDEIKLVEYFAKKYGKKYAVTPRFAPTCSMTLMKKVAQMAKKHGCYVQTHLSEHLAEVHLVQLLFSEQKSYTEVYEKAGLLGEKTILGHCIHMKENEWKILKKSGAAVAHCPTSNMALGSGRMPVEKLLKYKIPYALATDIGAGPHLSMIDVMREYVFVHSKARELSKTMANGTNYSGLRIPKITAIDALYRATLAGAQLMQIDKNHGNLKKGKSAEFVVIKNPSVVDFVAWASKRGKAASNGSAPLEVMAESVLQSIVRIPCEKIKLMLIS